MQPIAEAGLRVLRGAGLSVHVAAGSSLAVLRPHLANARAVITRNAGFSAEAMDAAPRLRVIGSHGTGVDAIDRKAAWARNIAVVNTPGANAQAVAELAFALILACAKSLTAADRATHAGDFDFRYRQTTFELSGRTLGLIGFGRIARRVASFGQAFGMRLTAFSRHASEAEMVNANVTPAVSLDALCASADVVSLHTMPTGEALFDAARLARLKPGALLVNTARGALIDESALAQALRSGRLAGAGLDVYAVEPPAPDSPLLSAPNLVLTPHIGGSAREALDRTAVEVARRVLCVLRGDRPAHLIDAGSGGPSPGSANDEGPATGRLAPASPEGL
jgi:D-3-phosphoglycerate dehydrogenase